MKKLLILSLSALALMVAGKASAADWSFDQAHTSFNFKVKHLVVTTVRGEFTDFAGTASFDPADLSTLSAEVTVQTASINTENEQRDQHLSSSDFLSASEYPEMTFKSTGAKVIEPGKTELMGDLTIRGVTKPVTFLVEGLNEPVNFGGTIKVGGTATATINRQDFGASWNKTLDSGGVVVGDEVQIEIELELNQQ
jgi:polyisoprenoid-binding protein YceI